MITSEMLTPGVGTVDLYWIWTLLSAVTVIGLGGLLISAMSWSRLRRRNQRLGRRILQLEQEVRALSAGSIGVGQRLAGVAQELQAALERQAELENRDPGQLPYRQAARLVGLGAGIEDLMESCGLSRGEAELLNLLQGGGVRQQNAAAGKPSSAGPMNHAAGSMNHAAGAH